jgi:hypothetical protein
VFSEPPFSPLPNGGEEAGVSGSYQPGAPSSGLRPPSLTMGERERRAALNTYGQVEESPGRQTRRANRSPVTLIRGCREPPRPRVARSGKRSARAIRGTRSMFTPGTPSAGDGGLAAHAPSAAAQTPDVAAGHARRPERRLPGLISCQGANHVVRLTP